MTGVSETTNRAVSGIAERLRALGYITYISRTTRLVWGKPGIGSGCVIVYESGRVVGELPTEYYL